jgi:thioesterase domain-containing protein
MLALQGEESYRTDGLPADLTLESLAARYADQILASHPGGPIHLIGFSAGGWYAHAVAAALLQRGASIGMVAVLDTHASARIHRRIGLQRMGRTLLRRLPHHLPQLIRPPAHQRRRHYVVERLQALHRHLNSHLGLRWRRSRPGFARPGDTPKPEAAATREDPFLALHRSYRPPRLPLVVDLFVPASRLALLNELWSFYGRQGVRLHPLFDDHVDFIHPDNMAALARALEDALATIEHGR